MAGRPCFRGRGLMLQQVSEDHAPPLDRRNKQWAFQASDGRLNIRHPLAFLVVTIGQARGRA